MEERLYVSPECFPSHPNHSSYGVSDTGTVDYHTTIQTRHLFRLAAMTEVPVSVEDWEKSQKEKKEKI